MSKPLLLHFDGDNRKFAEDAALEDFPESRGKRGNLTAYLNDLILRDHRRRNKKTKDK